MTQINEDDAKRILDHPWPVPRSAFDLPPGMDERIIDAPPTRKPEVVDEADPDMISVEEAAPIWFPLAVVGVLIMVALLAYLLWKFFH